MHECGCVVSGRGKGKCECLVGHEEKEHESEQRGYREGKELARRMSMVSSVGVILPYLQMVVAAHPGQLAGLGGAVCWF